MSTRIICLGNELVRDAGVRVGRVLQALPLPPDVQVELRPQPKIILDFQTNLEYL